jgi:hypothetical protein
MHLYDARVEVAHVELDDDRAEQVRTALERFEPSLGTSARGRLEVRVALTAENLMQATITAVSMVWTAVGAEPVAVVMEKS